MVRQPGADGYIHITYSVDDQSFATEVASAADMWNAVSGTTRVKFDPAPVGTKVDLPITFDSAGAVTGGCAAYVPSKMSVMYGSQWKTSLTPAAVIAHELGHFLGLADAGVAPSSPTIMNNISSADNCWFPPSTTTTPQTVDAVTSPMCRALSQHYLKELQKTQAVFDAQRARSTVSSWIYPPYPPPPYVSSQPWYCMYTYSTVNFYVDGQYDSSEQFVDGVTCVH